MGAEAGAAKEIAVLLVDDEACIREVIGEYLEDEGFQVTPAKSGEAALLALGKQTYDIVITDLRLPGMSGLDVVRAAKEKQPGTEVIVVTGYGTVADGVEAMRSGAFDFLLKPLKLEHLDAVLGRCVEWIQHKRSRAELEEVNRRLLELSRMKSKFLAVTDHELRTPVSVIDGMLQHLLRRGAELPEDLRARLDELGKVSRRLVDLVRGIHDLARSQTRGFLLNVDWIGPEDIARGISTDFAIAGFNRTLDLTLVCEPTDGIRVRGDLRRVRQVVTELIQNAVRATPDGGRVEVRLGGRETSGARRLSVEVADTGIGIPVEEQEKIFDAFYEVGDVQHHHSSEYGFQGAGLGIGLSLALEIARAHDGGIEVASRPGNGATFTFWLPAP